MRIIDIRETAVPLNSSLANSSFDFSEMTTSVVAVITDVVRDGGRVVGYAFNSTGRYACGATMRARFFPRILGAKPESLLDDRELSDRPGIGFEGQAALYRIMRALRSRRSVGRNSDAVRVDKAQGTSLPDVGTAFSVLPNGRHSGRASS